MADHGVMKPTPAKSMPDTYATWMSTGLSMMLGQFPRAPAMTPAPKLAPAKKSVAIRKTRKVAKKRR
jgi:hypothetical protein